MSLREDIESIMDDMERVFVRLDMQDDALEDIESRVDDLEEELDGTDACHDKLCDAVEAVEVQLAQVYDHEYVARDVAPSAQEESEPTTFQIGDRVKLRYVDADDYFDGLIPGDEGVITECLKGAVLPYVVLYDELDRELPAYAEQLERIGGLHVKDDGGGDE